MTLEIDRLSVRFADGDHALLALDRIDLRLTPGRVTALVGESGSGKTTLAKAVMGLLPENARVTGSVRVGGDEVLGAAEEVLNLRRWSQVAMVFQNGAETLNPVQRLVRQVAEPLVRHSRLDRRSAGRRAEQMLDSMGLTREEGRRYPHELSGGQVQRGLLAMALILDPPILLLDEPTAALDAMTRSFVAGVIADLRGRHKAVLLITHDLDLARRTADEAAVLYLGQVMEILPGEDLLARPCHPYTLALARSFPGMDAVRDLGGIRGDAFYRVIHVHAKEDGGRLHTHIAAPGAVHADGHAPPEGCLFAPRCTQAVDGCRSGEIAMVADRRHRVRCLRGGIAELLRLEGVAKAYGRKRVLCDTDLVLQAGEAFCLVGETGSGKTTLAMIAAGALQPDRGRRVFDGRDMEGWIRRDYRSLAPRVGIIYQNPAEAVSHRLPVFEIVAEPLRIQNSRLPEAEVRSRVLAALADVRLSTAPEFLRRYLHELNMGAIQRLCLARAMVHRPVLLVADEPTSSLDPSVQAKVLKMLLGLQIEKGLTLFFVTHDMGLARKVADRVGVMLAGRMVEVGPAARVIERPGHPYTRMLLDSARGAALSLPTGVGGNGGEAAACPFLARCSRPLPECEGQPPAAVDLDGGRHLAWCRRPLGMGGGGAQHRKAKVEHPTSNVRTGKEKTE